MKHAMKFIFNEYSGVWNLFRFSRTFCKEFRQCVKCRQCGECRTDIDAFIAIIEIQEMGQIEQFAASAPERTIIEATRRAGGISGDLLVPRITIFEQFRRTDVRTESFERNSWRDVVGVGWKAAGAIVAK